MAKPTSRQSLVDYSLRQLGAPVIKINLASEQIDDSMDDAIQLYQEYNSEGTIEVFKKHEITQTDIDNKYITVPESMIVISRVLPFDTSGDQFSTMWQIKFDSVNELNRGTSDLKNHHINMSHMALIEYMFKVEQAITFSRKQGKVYFEGLDWNLDVKVGDFIVFEGQEIRRDSNARWRYVRWSKVI